MVPGLKAHIALPTDLHLVPSTHFGQLITTNNSSSKLSNVLFWKCPPPRNLVITLAGSD